MKVNLVTVNLKLVLKSSCVLPNYNHTWMLEIVQTSLVLCVKLCSSKMQYVVVDFHLCTRSRGNAFFYDHCIFCFLFFSLIVYETNDRQINQSLAKNNIKTANESL